ncbi:WD40 repeat domain-containing protein [Leptothoe spongobia]|uniref:WD40 repeat domain-containing protein n=1 Tax=Leptothoe spongobia TAU-MAC 1115 TaxID=1967444 RepID=A0A947GI43_9CYAN|nr:WD40 repeat domain-containing protein [Leptothoe spongobia]MBT9314532.1 WD40 repeat domain-containing protein [Leptothoe spongobia TAU-MAC 1115]
MAKQILTQLSTHSLQVGAGRDQFEVMVNNLSDRFATFTLELSAPGIARNASQDWYRLTPDISAKIPAGDQANFIVNLLALPPVSGGFTGKMNLNVNVTCLELGEKDRQIINLVVQGPGITPPQISMSTLDFQGEPGDLIEIPLHIANHQRNTANIQVELKGLPQSWLIDGHKRRLQLSPRGQAELLFICQLPSLSEAPSQVYDFEVEASQIQTQPVSQAATLEILPVGSLLFDCDLAGINPGDDGTYDDADYVELWESRSHQSPSTEPETTPVRTSNGRDPISYRVTLDNASNVAQSVRIALNRIDVPWFKRLWATLQRDFPTPARTTRHCLQLSPSQVALKPGARTTMALTVQPQPPWWGWRRRQRFQLRSQLQQTDIDPADQQIELVIPPKIPLWLQCLALLLLGLALGLWFKHLTNHRAPVNAVQFDGQASMVISGANDNTIRRWQIVRRLRRIDVLRKDISKAVRVVRYRPRNNNVLAAGLENGEIQVWNLLSESSPKALVFKRDDRVFDLQFSPDSRSLFSAHGSGLVLRWHLQDLETHNRLTTPAQEKQFNFAIQAMAPIGSVPDEQTNGAATLAIGGRRNQLRLWNTQTNRVRSLPYPPGQEEDYITSLDTAENKLTRLATADNQGRISLWNMSRCRPDSSDHTNNTNCLPTDQWTDGHRERPVNAVALTQDGCYLVSGGDDGRVMLWSLNIDGQIMEHRQLAKFSKSINSVDIVQKENKLTIVSGGDNHQVKLHRTTADNTACP